MSTVPSLLLPRPGLGEWRIANITWQLRCFRTNWKLRTRDYSLYGTYALKMVLRWMFSLYAVIANSLQHQHLIVPILLQQLRVAEVETNKTPRSEWRRVPIFDFENDPKARRLRDKAIAEHAKYLKRIAGDQKKECKQDARRGDKLLMRRTC